MKIPIHVKRPGASRNVVSIDSMPTVIEKEPLARVWPVEESAGQTPPPRPGASARTKAEMVPAETKGAEEDSLEAWRDRAMRLQAEMENWRKWQQRLAQDAIQADRNRLLVSFLTVADNLERALNAETTNADSLRQGVALAHQALLQMLSREGVERIQPQGQPFDPAWHEAVDSVPSQTGQVEPGRVVQVVQSGYRLGERLLRPARVIVAGP